MHHLRTAQAAFEAEEAARSAGQPRPVPRTIMRARFFDDVVMTAASGRACDGPGSGAACLAALAAACSGIDGAAANATAAAVAPCCQVRTPLTPPPDGVGWPWPAQAFPACRGRQVGGAPPTPSAQLPPESTNQGLHHISIDANVSLPFHVFACSAKAS